MDIVLSCPESGELRIGWNGNAVRYLQSIDGPAPQVRAGFAGKKWRQFLMWLLYVAGFLILLVIIVKAGARRKDRQLQAYRKEYDELEQKYGYVRAREHCPHRAFTFSQTGIPGVVTMTTKWCKICGKDLGPAHLKESPWGNRWE
jgi:hypothetical protein